MSVRPPAKTGAGRAWHNAVMPKSYSMGGAGSGAGDFRIDKTGRVSQSMRERLGALRNVPPFIKLVWRTSPLLTAGQAVLRLVRALLPVATLYVGKLIIDAVVAM